MKLFKKANNKQLESPKKINYYEEITRLYNLIQKEYDKCLYIHQDLTTKFEFYNQEEDYEIYNSKLVNIKENILDNKLYKELLNGELETQINFLQNSCVAIEKKSAKKFLEKNYNDLNENEGLQQCQEYEISQEKLYKDLNYPSSNREYTQRGLSELIYEKKVNVKNKNNLYYDYNSMLYSPEVYYILYKIEIDDEDREQIKRLKALNLMIDDHKLSDIVVDLESRISELIDLEKDLNEQYSILKTKEATNPETLNIIDDYAQYLP